MHKKVLITEHRIMSAINELLFDCDYDTLARIAGDIFGGECWVAGCKKNPWDETMFEFTPDENYGGEFEDLVEDEENIILEPVKESDTNA